MFSFTSHLLEVLECRCKSVASYEGSALTPIRLASQVAKPGQIVQNLV